MDDAKRGQLYVELESVVGELGEMRGRFNGLAIDLGRLSHHLAESPEQIVFMKNGHSVGNTPLGRTELFDVSLADDLAKLAEQVNTYRDKQARTIQIQRELALPR